MARWILPEKRAAIYIRDRFTCCYCGSDLRHANRKEIGLDHLISRHHGGSNAATNLSTCCGLCNSSKGARDYNEYATGGSLARIERTRVLPVNVDLGRALIEGYGPEWECWGSDSDGDGDAEAVAAEARPAARKRATKRAATASAATDQAMRELDGGY